jgi:hypothetical protein
MCVFRRVFSDGKAVVRIEVGLALSRDRHLSLPLTQVLAGVQDAIELSTEVRVSTPLVKSKPLITQGPQLAALYSRATSRHANGPQPAKADPLVEPGNPVLLIETLDFNASRPPGGVSVIDAGKVLGANLAFAWLKTQWGEVATWILSQGAASPDQLRSLRLCLLRLHAEQEVLDQILKQMDSTRIVFKPRTALGDRLEDYLNRATRVINRSGWSRIDQSAILEAFDAAIAVRPDAGRSLLARYTGARQEVLRKAEEFRQRREASRIRTVIRVGKGGTVVKAEGSGQVIVNSKIAGDVINNAHATITDSFNKFASDHPADDELKQQVTLLQAKVKELTAALASTNPQDTQLIADNAATFIEEAGKEKPRVGTLQSTGQAIVDAATKAAKTVGQVASVVAPIAGAVASILKVFGVLIPV